MKSTCLGSIENSWTIFQLPIIFWYSLIPRICFVPKHFLGNRKQDFQAFLPTMIIIAIFAGHNRIQHFG